jgi:hypothetical protein
MERRTHGAIADDLTAKTYRLISIDRTGAPTGATGDDWVIYRIAQGANVVTGYRRGRRQDVSVAVESMVEALNVRHLVKGRLYRSARPPPAPPPRHKDLIH